MRPTFVIIISFDGILLYTYSCLLMEDFFELKQGEIRYNVHPLLRNLKFVGCPAEGP